MADRFCGNCGQELRPDDRFCLSCGRAVHEVAYVPTPEADRPVPRVPPAAPRTPWQTFMYGNADVPVPPLPSSQEQDVGKVQGVGGGGRVSSADGNRNTLLTVGIIGLVIWLVVALGAGSPGGVTFSGVGLAVVLYLAFYRPVNAGATDSRTVLRAGSEHPIPDAERVRLLDEEIAQYSRDGFFLRQRTPTSAQLVKPKKFSFIWALLWFLMLGVGLIVYLIYYAAKQDEGRYVEVDEYGAVRATRQVRHVL